MGKLFGTDGIRGIVNRGLDAPLAYRVGQAAAIVLTEEKKGKALFLIGKDTRISSDLLEGALIAGLCASGADVLTLGVIPTPAVAFLTISEGADAGIVISASHNPFEHNGIKLFSREGFKLSDTLEQRIEDLVLSAEELPTETGASLGRVVSYEHQMRDRYLDHLEKTVHSPLAGLRVLVDCANGAASKTAPDLFARFPLHTDFIHAEPNGTNINDGCGSTHLESLAKRVREGKYDVGIAFDGDADRCLLVDELGNPVDGDRIMAVCGRAMKRAGKLPFDTIVGTVMSNVGFHRFAKDNGICLLCANVGDRNVLEMMQEGGFLIGGEQSGHLIFLDYATTGDGQLAALQFLQLLCESGQPVSKLVSDVPKYPQVLINIPVSDEAVKESVMDSKTLRNEIRKREMTLGEDGRILVRASGTEALVRVMVEAPKLELANSHAEELAILIKSLC